MDAGSSICQDAAEVIHISDNVVVAAVADGVGSEDHSELASEAAVKACCSYCKDHYYDLEIKALINNSFYAALFAVQDVSAEKSIPMNQLHCTLCVVVYTDQGVYCGNVGDSGAIGLRMDGEYELLTKPQNDIEGRVMPLCESQCWVFTQYEGSFASIMLATDGFYNYLFPPYLPDAISDGYNIDKKHLDEERISSYLDKNDIDFQNNEMKSYFDEKIDQISRNGGIDSIVDDLTVVILYNEKKPIAKERCKIDREKAIKDYSLSVESVLYSSTHEDGRSNNQDNDQSEITAPPDDELINNLSEAVKKQSQSNPIVDSNEMIVEDHNGSGCLIYVKNDDKKSIEETEKKLKELNKWGETYSIENIEWPIELLYADNQLIGYRTSPHIQGDSVSEYYDYLVPMRLGIAYTVASKMKKINENGIHISSFKDVNIIFNKDDVDIFFINIDYNNVYTSVVDDSIISSERKSLATVIFKLLFNGHDPFKNNLYIFKNPDSFYPGVPNIASFPPSLQKNFQKSFCEEKGAIPGPQEWMDSLVPSDYIKCKNDPTHIYYKDALSCPYCDCIKSKSKE